MTSSRLNYFGFTFLALLLSTLLMAQQEEDKTIPAKKKQPYLIILSLDGFRWNYPDQIATPNLDNIAKNGVRASLQASFPTKTFPNHYSIATGLYPDHHGIVNNTFYEPKRAVIYKIGDNSKVQDGYFYGGEPFWVTAEKQGVKTASFHWVGTTAPIKGVLPSIYKVYSPKPTGHQKVDSLIAWLQLPIEHRPHLITWYMPEPDGVGHDFGPESEAVHRKVQELDSLVGYFMDEINKLPISSEINIIVTSDHGMQEISSERVVLINQYLKKEYYQQILGSNPVYNIWAKKGYIDSIRYAFTQVKGIKCYSASTIPPHLHYMTNERCGDLVLLADSAYSIQMNKITIDAKEGTHGYDPANSNMNAIFFAQGPAFKKQSKLVHLQNVDIYNMICKIMNLNPAQNDGDNDGILLLQ